MSFPFYVSFITLIRVVILYNSLSQATDYNYYYEGYTIILQGYISLSLSVYS